MGRTAPNILEGVSRPHKTGNDELDEGLVEFSVRGQIAKSPGLVGPGHNC